MAKLPTVVSNLAPDLRAFVNRVREAIDGKGNDKLVTVDDLIRGGIAVPGPGGTIIPPAGGGTIATPPAPTSLSATGAIQNIIVEWDDPRYFGHAYAEVWGASTDSLGDAVLLGMTPGSIYVDAIGPGSVRYYWVRFVNTLDTAGPYNAVDGTRGETGPDVAYLLETLTGAITETQLFSSLGARIDNIEVNTTAIQTEATTRATADSALASQVTTVQASVNNNTAAIQTEATARVNADNSLFAQYTVKIDLNGYVSGFGLASTANNATPFSDFIIRADRFSVASPTGPGITPVIPFIVTTTPQTINGVTVPVGVYINGAYIQNGTITNAKIGNAAIDDAKIVSLSAGKISAGSISVGSYIQSSDYLIGSQGWKIHGDGTAEFAAASIRGQLTAAQINTNGLSIRDTAGNIILNAGTGNFTGSLNGTAASTVVSNASTALSTANSAASTASTAQSTANTANSTANSAASTASTAQSTANSAASTASAAQSTANTANSTANAAIAELGGKLDNDARNVLSGSGGIALGTLNWDSNGVRTSGYGVGLTRAGFAAFNSSGTPTFTLSASTGDATFAGSLSAATGTFAGSLSAATGTFSGSLSAATGTFSGSLSAATGTFSGSLTASAINAVNTINIAGQAVTVPAGASQASVIGLTSGWTTLLSVAVDSAGNPIYVSSVLTINGFYNEQQMEIRILNNGSTAASWVLPAESGATSVKQGAFSAYLASPGTGSRTITVQALNPDASARPGNTLFAIGTKR